jgi:hypothetical protein
MATQEYAPFLEDNPFCLSIEMITPMNNDTPEPEKSGLEAVNASPISQKQILRTFGNLPSKLHYKFNQYTLPMLVTRPLEIHLKIFNLLNLVSSACLNLCNKQLLCNTLGLRGKFFSASGILSSLRRREKLGSSERVQLW